MPLSAEVIPTRGLIVYIDRIPASVRLPIIDEMLKIQYFYPLSSDDYAEKNNERPYKSAVLTFKEAVARASKGERILLDSTIVENYFIDRDIPAFDIVVIGIWCQLSCLRERYDANAKEPGAYRKSHLEADYLGRYGDKTPEEIRKDSGAFRYNPTNFVKFDLFIDVENMTPKVIAEKISTFVDKKFAEPEPEVNVKKKGQIKKETKEKPVLEFMEEVEKKPEPPKPTPSK